MLRMISVLPALQLKSLGHNHPGHVVSTAWYSQLSFHLRTHFHNYQSCVCLRLRRRRAKDFVQCSSSVWSLTPSGRSRGLTIQRNHRLWTQYLTSHADIAANHVDWSVDQVEHVLSDDLVAQLEDQLRLGSEP